MNGNPYGSKYHSAEQSVFSRDYKRWSYLSGPNISQTTKLNKRDSSGETYSYIQQKKKAETTCIIKLMINLTATVPSEPSQMQPNFTSI